MPLTATAVAGAATGIAQIFTGAHKLKKDEQELSKLKRPFYKIQNEYLQNRNLAAEDAEAGLPESTKDYLTTETQRNQSASIKALLESGGNPSDITKIFDIAGRSLSRTASEDAQTKLKNIEYFMGVNKDLAGQENIQFGVNELQPYEQKLKEITERRQTDESNIWGGLKTVVGAGSAYATGKSNQDLNKAMVGNQNTQANFYRKLFSDGSSGISDPYGGEDGISVTKDLSGG